MHSNQSYFDFTGGIRANRFQVQNPFLFIRWLEEEVQFSQGDVGCMVRMITSHSEATALMRALTPDIGSRTSKGSGRRGIWMSSHPSFEVADEASGDPGRSDCSRWPQAGNSIDIDHAD